MIEKGKISAFQMALILYPTIYATAILIVPAITGKYAGRDMWMSPILGSLMGFFTIFIMYKLHEIYPNETIIEYSKHIIGTILAKILGIAYILFFLYLGGFIMREYATFIIISFLPKTPMVVIIGSIILVSAMAVSGGVEVIGRASLIFVPLFILPIPVFMLLLAKDLDFKTILPIMENGMMPIIRGAFAPQAWFSEVFLMAMLLPYIKDRQKAVKWSIITVFAVMLSLVSLNLLNIFLFGELTLSYTYPVFKAIRYISLSDFFEHLEAAIIAIWMLGAFIKITVFYYALVLGTAQWLRLSNFKPIILPLGFLISLFGIWEFYNLQEQTEFSEIVFPLYVPLMSTVLPALLLVIAKFRKRDLLKKKANSGLSNKSSLSKMD
ncbi:endospore germination permease [Actinomycetes bacterium NPDC127524]